MKIRVLIVDDHTIVRTGLRALINGEPDMDLIGEAVGGEQGMAMAEELRPDVLVLDISLPDMDGIQVARRIKSNLPEMKVLILTVHEDEALLRESISAGASGYIIKHAAELELISAIRAVQNGDLYVHPRMIRGLISDTSVTGNNPGTNPSLEEILTPREIEVLKLIVQGYTNRQIAEELILSVRTVEGHRANLTEKLGLKSRVDLVRFARSQGLTDLSQ